MGVVLFKILFLYLIAGYVGKKDSEKEKNLYGLIIELTRETVTGRLYEMEIKPNVTEFPIRNLKKFSYLLQDEIKQKENIIYAFMECLRYFSEQTEAMKEPNKVFLVVTGSEHIDKLRCWNKESFDSSMSKIYKILTERGYSKGKKGFIQILKKNEMFFFTSISSLYNNSPKEAVELHSTIFLDSYSLDIMHPAETKIYNSPLYDNIKENILNKTINLNVLNLKCYGYEEMSAKYYFHIIKAALSSENPKIFISPCESVNISINLTEMKNECNEHIFDKIYPEKVTFYGTNDKVQCDELLKMVFCSGFPMNNTCPFEHSNINIFKPTDKQKPIYLGGYFLNFPEFYGTATVSELAKKILTICFPSNKKEIPNKYFCRFQNIYMLFIMNHFTNDLEYTKFLSHEKTWHLGKMIENARDFKETFDGLKKNESRKSLDASITKSTIPITVLVIAVLLIILVGLVIFYLKYMTKKYNKL